jgi:hypothetical protein
MESQVDNYIVNERPVQVIRFPNGEIDVLAYDFDEKKFVRKMFYLSMITYGREEIKQVTEQELFNYITENS